MPSDIENINPEVVASLSEREHSLAEDDDSVVDPIDQREHPLTLEEIKVAQFEHIRVDDKRNSVEVLFTPTIPHCSMATLIGLCIRVRLLRSLPDRFKVDVRIRPGTHASEAAGKCKYSWSVNKQLNDKERVAAALENDNLLVAVNRCLTPQR
ncbi:hypothetical protein CAOG_02803 [Capsaspora owczarzaki ATCC 30864]|uniref:Uncharacterized protein n=1 Tax=Capsaspora owczarzaki (strain ATCC 30864) TaxID=595528 RepID=A0A0D2VN72_CAPO3|nr:hypothetical protein CAOG_02803 [Capsaspora owczarzaki ATCC 30864]KJE91707.1 hypothetical protein CAOG_002803 [Capsaspora owczarzaki ATCC 30864]|eukprot:XP_004348616.1 hypothetical protein CAOG_02803 [Capsaspora owczarzaki ATCC 30864]